MFSKEIRIHGAFDVHVHDRGLNQAHVATSETESRAAIAGGYVGYLAMPNTEPPLTNRKNLEQKLLEAKASDIYYGAYLAGVDGNQNEVLESEPIACGLKLYMDNTTGNLLIEDENELDKHFLSWPGSKPICVHAEGKTLLKALNLCKKYKKHLHVCHVSTKEEVLMIREAKRKGLRVTCEVTPHHLFLTEDDLADIGPLGIVKPSLKTKEDQEALWEALRSGVIDMIASDHAPHPLKDKNSKNPPYGMPGLETTIPLMLMAQEEGKLTFDRLLQLISYNPRRIFGIECINDSGSYTTVEVGKPHYLNRENLHTNCGWSAFEGHKMLGIVREVFVAGEKVYHDGEFMRKFNSKSLILFSAKKSYE